MYVPGLAQNLISLGQLMKKGYFIMFDDSQCLIYKKEGKELVAISNRSSNNMYPLLLIDLGVNVLKAKCSNAIFLCHQRLGHLNVKSLHYLSKEKLVHGLLETLEADGKICEDYIFEK